MMCVSSQTYVSWPHPTFHSQGEEMCEHSEVRHSIGNKWISEDCMECRCRRDGLHCCSTYATPTNFPSDCVAELDKKNCKYVVHKKDDPKILCPIFGSVG
uniref:Beta-microseminoprotein n=1 Tax=Eptatretus burgeri TaxID=7764 RepID=A0A8C4QLS2_EPTBU